MSAVVVEAIEVASPSTKYKIDNDGASSHPGYVFVSYCHKQQEQVKKICRILEDHGVRYWVDYNDMKIASDIYQLMAEGISNAAVVLICFSNDYQASENCMREANYTATTKKACIPVKVHPEVILDGALGLLIGSRLYLDYYKGDFNVKLLDAVRNYINLPQMQLADDEPSSNKRKQPQPWRPQGLCARLGRRGLIVVIIVIVVFVVVSIVIIVPSVLLAGPHSGGGDNSTTTTTTTTTTSTTLKNRLTTNRNNGGGEGRNNDNNNNNNGRNN